MIDHRQTLAVCLIFSALLFTCIVFDDYSVYAGWRRPDSDTDDQPTTPKDTDESQEKTEETDDKEKKQQDTKSSGDTATKLVQGGVIGGLSAAGAKVANDKLVTNHKRKRKDIRQTQQEPVMVAGPVTPATLELARKAQDQKLTPQAHTTIHRTLEGFRNQQPKDEIDIVSDDMARNAANTPDFRKADDKHFKNALKKEASEKRDKCEKDKLVRCPRCREAVPMKNLASAWKGTDLMGIDDGSGMDHNRVIHKGCRNPTRETAGSRVRSLFNGITGGAPTGIPIDQIIPEWEAYKIDNGATSPITHIKCVNSNCPKKYVPRKQLTRPPTWKLWDKKVTCSKCNTKQYEPPPGSYSHPEYGGQKFQLRRGGNNFRPSGHKY